ncbi:MAG: glucosylceramidase [Clostridia bacterium]|nr:glucosylceramidase [Clostridia bacterium]
MKQHTTRFSGGQKIQSVQEIRPDQAQSMREKDLVNLYPSVRYQQIEGFGGAFTDAAGYVFSLMPEDRQKQFLDGYFSESGLGYVFGRTSVDSCDFSCEMYAAGDGENNEDLHCFDMSRPMRYVLPLIRRAEETAGRKIRMMFTPWSPPAWMKTNGSRIGGGQLKEEYAPLWAEYICRYLLEAEKLGMQACFLSTQNEPNATQVWDSCRLTGAEEGDFIRRYLYPALQKNGLDHVSLLIWDHNKERAFDRACETICDPEMEKIVGGVAVHWYSGDHFEALQMIRERFPDKRIVFSEACVEYSLYKGDNQLRNARMYAHELIGSLNHGLNVFLDWNLLLDEQGGPNHVGNYCDAPVMYNTRTGDLAFNLSFDYIGHFSRFIKPGARRIGMSRFGGPLEVTAAENPDGTVCAVVLNPADEKVSFFLRVNGRVWPVTQEGDSISTYVFPPEDLS